MRKPDFAALLRTPDLGALMRKRELALLSKHPQVRRMLLPAAGAIFFIAFIIVTFPYDLLARRIEIEARRSGAELSIGRMGPSFLTGVRARDVRIRFPQPPGEPPAPEIRIDRADISPDLFPLLFGRTAFGFRTEAYGGIAKGHLALSSDPRQPGLSSLRIDARDIDLSTLPIRQATGLQTTGKLQLKADLPALLPVETARGSISLAVDGVALSGAVMGFTLPATGLGRIEGGATVDRGIARVERTASRGGDIDADLDGNVNLRPLLALSQADLHLRFRPSDRWLEQNPTVKGMMGLIQDARQGDGSYAFTLAGPLSGLQARPGK